MASWSGSSSGGTVTTNIMSIDDNGDDTYTIHYSDGTSSVVDKNTLSTSVGVSFGEPLTADERNKLAELKEERTKWVRTEKLKNFQNLPPHLRQEIVDEACIREYLYNASNVNELNFDDQSEINRLEEKDRNSYNNIGGFNYQHQHVFLQDGSGFNLSDDYIFKYGVILNEFTKDELVEAHGAATLEESLEE